MDAWHGMAEFARTEEFGKVGVTKAEYEEWGGERKQWKCQSGSQGMSGSVGSIQGCASADLFKIGRGINSIRRSVDSTLVRSSLSRHTNVKH